MRKLYLLLSLFFVSSSGWAYYATMDTGEIIPVGRNRVMLSPQFIMTEIDGLNITGRFDGAVSDEFGYRIQTGVGEVDFHAGGFVKWIPIPDLDNQPAIGLLAGAIFGHFDHHSHLSLRLHPLISKKVATSFGSMTPFGSIPFGLDTASGHTEVPMQLVVGSEMKIDGWSPDIRLIAELGFNVRKAFSYFSVGFSYEFDGI